MKGRPTRRREHGFAFRFRRRYFRPSSSRTLMTIPSSPLVPSSYHIARSTCTRRLSRRWTSATSSHSIRTGVAASFVVAVNRSRTTGSAPRENHRRTYGGGKRRSLWRRRGRRRRRRLRRRRLRRRRRRRLRRRRLRRRSRRVISEISFLDLHVNHFFSVHRASATRPKVLPTAWS